MINTTRREFLQTTVVLPLLPIISFEEAQEEGEIAYKVVTRNMWSHSHWMMDGSPIKYEINKWISPNLGKGKLFVFSNLGQAKYFIKTYYGRNTFSPKIFKCLCLDITDNIYDSGYTGDERQDPGWPIGTMFASKVKLIEEI